MWTGLRSATRVIKGALPIENGCYLLGDAPGWGVDVDEAVLAQHRIG